MTRDAWQAALVVAGVLLVVALVATARYGWGTSERAPGHLSEGDVVVTPAPDGSVEIAVVGTGSSGLGACDRLMATTHVEDDSFVVDLARSWLAYGCNDDAIPIVVRVRVPADTASELGSVEVTQHGAPIGYHVIPGARP